MHINSIHTYFSWWNSSRYIHIYITYWYLLQYVFAAEVRCSYNIKYNVSNIIGTYLILSAYMLWRVIDAGYKRRRQKCLIFARCDSKFEKSWQTVSELMSYFMWSEKTLLGLIMQMRYYICIFYIQYNLFPILGFLWINKTIINYLTTTMSNTLRPHYYQYYLLVKWFDMKMYWNIVIGTKYSETGSINKKKACINI